MSTTLRYRDLNAIANAVALLANKALPTKEARIHIARCVRWSKPFVEEYQTELQLIREAHKPADDGEAVGFTDPVGMACKIRELDTLEVADATLPPHITDAMLPVNDKAHPNNEDALSAILADLGPLYDLGSFED